jgi:hypothetical protein
MNEQFAALLPTVTDRVDEAAAEFTRVGGTAPTAGTENKFIYFDPVPSPETFFEMEKNYGWKRVLFNEQLPTGTTPFQAGAALSAGDATTARNSGFDCVYVGGIFESFRQILICLGNFVFPTLSFTILR